MSAAVTFRDVDIIFGPSPKRALKLLDQGRNRDEILAATGHVVGVTRASLTVEPGQICVLMGLSGSGKSTLLRAVNRLNRPVRGDVLVRHRGGEVNVTTCNGATLRDLRSRSVAMVFQQFALLPWRSVRDNVGMGLELRGLGRTERNRIVDQKLDMVGLSAWADKHAHELSGGMQQRVGLARAFATDADILLMDEPFSALDPLIRSKLQDELLQLQAELKKTILFVSHDLDEAIKLGNRIVIMEGGRIVQAGTVQDIVLRPADSYVEDFVRHMNPLDALKADTFMTPLDGHPRDGTTLLTGAGHAIRIDLGPDGRACGMTVGGEPCRFAGADELDGHAGHTAVVVPADLPLKQAVALRHKGHAAILVVDRTGALVGTACDADIFRALLRG